jgi:heam-based aerotactic trancducer
MQNAGQSLTTLFDFDPNVRAQRLKMYRITPSDQKALRALKPFFDKHMTQIVDAFYDHLLQFPEAVQVIQSAGSSVEKLKKTNSAYFAEIVRGEFGDEYFENRLKVGMIHAKIGLGPTWFYAAMGTY